MAETLRHRAPVRAAAGIRPLLAWRRIYGGWILPLAFLAVAPVALFAPNGLVVVLVAAALPALPLWRWPRRIASVSGRPLLVLLAALAAAGLLSLTVAADPGRGFFLWIRLAAMIALGLALVAAIPRLGRRLRRRLARVAVIAVVAGLALVAVTAAAWWLAAPDTASARLFRANRAITTLAVVAWPVAAALARRHSAAGAGLIAALLVLAVCLDSLSALMAVVAGAGAAVAVLARPALRAAAAALIAVFILAAPWIVAALPPVRSLVAEGPAIPPSAEHRLYIYAFSAERIAERPWLGWGLEEARSLPGGTAAVPVGSEALPLHPHNLALHLWVELGLPGALAGALLVAWLVTVPGRRDGRLAEAAVTATAVAYVTIGMTAFGAWQNKWIAVAWLAAALVTATRPVRPGAPAAARPDGRA